jgi:hypothetical protein
MTTPSDANARQVGGAHYKANYQHWDLVADLGLGYFEGQITKYIVRHQQKEGLKDVLKCQHFIEKLIELACQGRAAPKQSKVGYFELIDRFLIERLKAGLPALTSDEVIVLERTVFWNGTGRLEDALEACKRVASTYPAP